MGKKPGLIHLLKKRKKEIFRKNFYIFGDIFSKNGKVSTLLCGLNQVKLFV
jgi:hypothetical protein